MYKKTPFEIVCDGIITFCWAVICCCFLYMGCTTNKIYNHISQQQIEIRK